MHQNESFLRISAVAPEVAPADTEANGRHIVEAAKAACADDGADLIVMPEMSVTGYTCGDLFHQELLLGGALEALTMIARETASLPATIVVGAPVVREGALYNCAVAISKGHVRAVVPKTYIPNYNEFYEKRHWAGAPQASGLTIDIAGEQVPFGTDVLLEVAGASVAIEICEDLWTAIPPSCQATLVGAEVVVNLSASDDLTGKYDYLLSLIAQQSARCICAYAYASAGYGESSTDLVFDAKTVIAESGRILAKGQRWQATPQRVTADVDLAALRRDRMHISSVADCAERNSTTYRHVACTEAKSTRNGLEALRFRNVDPRPFVPAGSDDRNARCREIIEIQAAGLARRLDATHTKTIVVGISGGLDSTLALLVAAHAFDRLKLPRTGITGVTMPGFGTTGRTHSNSLDLMRAMGVTAMEIPIGKAVEQHFADIGQDPNVHDVTYENSQARERTQILMDLANRLGGMVLGTGDMSELALGWATYNGDHMSMYGVNAGVPKTLVRHLVQYFADTTDDEAERHTLLDIIDTPISPELIPAAADGTIVQRTEDLVGPYELHDFYIYNTLRYGFEPRRVYLLALKAFAGSEYTPEVILKWLRTFYRRFFAQQFKRSCMPDGPKVGSVCLSPRGDWRMPSDASSALWIKECDALVGEKF